MVELIAAALKQGLVPLLMQALQPSRCAGCMLPAPVPFLLLTSPCCKAAPCQSRCTRSRLRVHQRGSGRAGDHSRPAASGPRVGGLAWGWSWACPCSAECLGPRCVQLSIFGQLRSRSSTTSAFAGNLAQDSPACSDKVVAGGAAAPLAELLRVNATAKPGVATLAAWALASLAAHNPRPVSSEGASSDCCWL